ncbi:MAG: RNA 2',3'-cyclic phosphodiesterase [Candidatus Limnocylindrales bacterium]
MTGRGRWVDPFAGIPGRRLFIAAPLPAEAVAAVSAIVEAIRAQPLPDGMHDVRWVRLDGLHLTLRFLGPTTEDRVVPTTAAMDAVAQGTSAIPARLAGTGFFPATGRPRTLWVGLIDGAEALTAVARELNETLAAAGWTPEARPFRAHLTLARSDGLPAGAVVAERLADAIGDRSIPFVIERLALFESVTGGGPARYVPVAEAALLAMH